MSEYEIIDDFGREARTRLVEERKDEIRWLLDQAFSDFVDAEPEVSLASFGFRGDDPVAEAVDWAIHRFASASLDADRIRPGSRSFRIFTEVRFWLAQKVGRQGYEQLIARARGRVAPPELDDTQAERDTTDHATSAFGEALANELPGFRDRTCADLVGFWLAGTRRMRRDWFGWRVKGELSEAAGHLSKKQRSVYSHDAMFRFLCCFHRLVPSAPAERAEHVFELTSLSGCPDKPPYRVDDREFIHLGPGGVRDITQLRKEGARQHLHRCVALARGEGGASTRGPLAATFTRKSLRLTTLHALGVEDDLSLRSLLDEGCDDASEERP